MPSHTNPKVSLGASIPVASSRFQSATRHFPELGILPQMPHAAFAAYLRQPDCREPSERCHDHGAGWTPERQDEGAV